MAALIGPPPASPADAACVSLPLAGQADAALRRLAAASASPALAALDGATLLGERAMLGGFVVPQRVSAGGGCRLFDAQNGTIALNLARASDRELLPALFESEQLDPSNDAAIAGCIARSDAEALVARGRSMGLAIAGEAEAAPAPLAPCTQLIAGSAARARIRDRPRVVDLSALWAGPLAAHLLWLAGAEVVKVESRTRPDAMRSGDAPFYALLNQAKASVALDLTATSDRQALRAIVAAADIVIEAARPRALAQLGIDAAAIVRETPGLVWITITGHGAEGDAADWVGFGDDCGVAAGLSAALRAASGRGGFVGDAIADPLTGIHAALAAWNAWQVGEGGRFALALRAVVARCLAEAQADAPDRLQRDLKQWSAAAGKPFPLVKRRRAGVPRPFGADTRSWLAAIRAG